MLLESVACPVGMFAHIRGRQAQSERIFQIILDPNCQVVPRHQEKPLFSSMFKSWNATGLKNSSTGSNEAVYHFISLLPHSRVSTSIVPGTCWSKNAPKPPSIGVIASY